MDVKEGVVAVIQGTEDAGLTVTLVGRNNRKTVEKKSTREFSKSPPSPRGKRNYSLQICDGRYASSYQLQHCGVTPSSPPVDSPEFPLQRAGPSRAAPSHRSPRDMENFISSLRKYPSNSPQMSSDMLHRLLIYTQNKNLTKSSYHTKTVRSLTKLSPNTKTSRNKVNKNPTMDSSAYTNDETRNYFVTNKCKTGNTFGTDNTSLRYKDSLLNTTYDYLKCTNVSQKDHGRVSEVRYLSDMSRCIRDTLKQLYDDNSNVCPKIRDRYCNHQKEHHGRCSSFSPPQDTSSAEIETQVPLPSTSRADKEQSSDAENVIPTLCCICDQFLPCGCKKTTRNVDRVEEVIQEWEKNIPVYANETVEDKAARKKMLYDLAEKLTSLNNVDEYNDEIKKCLKNLPMWSSKNENEKEMLNSMLTNSLLENLERSQDGSEDEKIRKIIQEIPLRIRDGNGMMVDKEIITNDLLKKIKELSASFPSSNINDDKGLKEVIASLLEDLPVDATDTEKDKIISKLTDNVTEALSKIPTTSSYRPQKTSLDSIKDFKSKNNVIMNKEAIEKEIWDLVEDYPEISSSHSELEPIVKKLASKLESIKSKNFEQHLIEDEMQNELKYWLKDLSNKTDGKFEKQNEFSKRLLNKINKQQTRINDKSYDVKEQVLVAIDDILDPSSIKLSENKKKNIEDKINQVLANKISIVQSPRSDKVKTEIRELLLEEGVNEAEAENLANKFIQRAQGLEVRTPQNESFFAPLKKEVKEYLHGAVEGILNNTSMSSQQRSEISATLNEILADHIMRGEDDKKTVGLLTSILRDENLSSNEVDDISNKLLESAKTYSSSIKPNIRFALTENADEDILTYLEDLTGDENHKEKYKRKSMTQQMMNKLQKILDNPNVSLATKETKMKEEIDQYLDKLSLDTNMPIEVLAAKLIEQIKDNTLKTSTPRGSMDKEKSFLTKDTTEPSSINIDDFSSGVQNSKIKNENANYLKQVTEVMQQWINEVLNNVDKNIKDPVIEDLAVGIVDRKNYLQINPNARTSEKEELEHLKYQIFRSLNKILEENTIYSVIQEAKLLMEKINSISVPNISQSLLNKSEDNSLVKELVQEITKWFKEIPAHMYKTKDENYHKSMIESLALRIHELRTGQSSVEEELKAWLKLMVKDNQALDLNEIINDLKVRIDFPVTTNSVIQNTSPILEEKLVDAVLEWIRERQTFLRRNSLDKRIQEQLVEELVRSLISTLDSTYSYYNLEKLWFNLILEMFKQFPLDAKHKFNKEFHFKAAEQLLEYLKNSPVFKDISEKRISLTSDQSFTTKVEEWMKSLPVRSRSSITKQMENVNNKFVALMKDMKEQYEKSPSDPHRNKIKDEIIKYLNKFPISPPKKNDMNFMIEKMEELLKIFKESFNDIQRPSTLSSKPLPKNTHDVLYESVENWFEDLMSDEALSHEEKDMLLKNKNDLARKLMIKIGELNMNPEVLRDDFMYENLLQNKIEQLLSSIGITTDNKKKMSDHINKLLEKIKETKRKIENKLAGTVYKQQLRETAHKYLSNSLNVPIEEKTDLDMLVDNIADNFINLNYTADDGESRQKYKDKLNTEIKNYFDKHVRNGPLDIQQFNKDLYNVMKQVSIPTDDSMRFEVDELKIKDKISEQVEKLPLNIETTEKQAEVNKLINGLAKTLNEFEEEINTNSDSDHNELVQAEITRFIKKLPLRPENEGVKDNFIKNLTDEIKNTRSQRKQLIKRNSADVNDHDINKQTKEICPYYKLLLDKICNNSCISKFALDFPNSTLSTEDKALLYKIKQRNLPENAQKFTSQDAGVNPLPIDVSSQTDVLPQCQNKESNASSRSMQLKVVSSGSGYENICIKKNGLSMKAPCSSIQSKVNVSTLPKNVQSETLNKCQRIGNDQPNHSSTYAPPCRQSRNLCPNITQRPLLNPPCQIINRQPYIAVPGRPSRRQSCYVRSSVVPTCPSPKHPINICPSSRPNRHRTCVTKMNCVDQINKPNNLGLQMRKSKENILESDGTDSDYCSPCSRHFETRSHRGYNELDRRNDKSSFENDQNICRNISYGNYTNLSPPINAIHKCSRCCGAHCPYPSYLYFKS